MLRSPLTSNNIFEPGKEFEAQAAIDVERRWLQYTNPGMGALTAHVKASQSSQQQAEAEPGIRGSGRKGLLGWLLG